MNDDVINNFDTSHISLFPLYQTNKLHYGRQRIVVDDENVTKENIIEILKKALKIHRQNRIDCDYLIHYWLGEQDILRRPSSSTSEINNTFAVNFAFPIVRQIVGYTFGNSIQLLSNDLNKQESVTKLADYYKYENDYYVDICTAIIGSICGLAYQITLPSEDVSEDYTPEIPLKYDYLDPRDTFVVYSNKITRPILLSCHIIRNSDRSKTYYVYTNESVFIIKSKNFNTLDKEKDIEEKDNPIGLNPITMIENSIFLTGDFEQVLPVLNATNQVASDSMNEIEGVVKSLLVILGAEFDEDDPNGTDIKKVKKTRILSLTGKEGSGNLDAKFISPKLDSVGVENLRKYLEEAKDIISGIPDRKSQSTGGDTGVAVLNRDGWTDIEIVARFKELFFKKGKKSQLAVGIKILQNLGLLDKTLTVLDIEPVIGRHTTDNLLTKAQAFSALVATRTLADVDALELSGLTNKSRELIERGKVAQKEKDKLEKELNPQLTNSNNPTNK